MTGNPPLLTIASVCLNNAHGLEKTWHSLKGQSFQGLEWLIQDGRSQDNTLELLEKIQDSCHCKEAQPTWQSPAIFVESKPDNGIYDAMNRLIERSNGEYILFLNAGDCLANNNTLQIIADMIASDRPHFIYGDSLESDHLKRAKLHTNIAVDISKGMFTHHQAMVYKREAIGDLRYNLNYTIAADYDFTARFLKHNQNIRYIPEPICIFEPGGISQQQTAKGRREQFQIRKTLKLCSHFENYKITAQQNAAIYLRNISPKLYWFLRRG